MALLRPQRGAKVAGQREDAGQRANRATAQRQKSHWTHQQAEHTADQAASDQAFGAAMPGVLDLQFAIGILYDDSGIDDADQAFFLALFQVSHSFAGAIAGIECGDDDLDGCIILDVSFPCAVIAIKAPT